MELNNISSLNTPNIQDNTNKNKITSSDLHSSINKPDKETVKLTKNNLQSYKLDISSNSAQKAKEQSYYSNSSYADNSAGAQAINDTYMADIVKKSQEKTKPDGVKMDDVSWGLLVEMGEQMGLTDPEKLAKLTIKDVEAYFYTKNIVERGKNLLKDNLTANEYAEYKNTKFDSESYWDNVFDENGNKKDYSIYTINQSNSGLPLSSDEFNELLKKVPTPFYLYDGDAIRKNAKYLYSSFSWADGFKNFFAVKALPNVNILRFLSSLGFGAVESVGVGRFAHCHNGGVWQPGL